MVATSSNITNLTPAEAALRESEAVLRSFFDSAGAMRGIVELEPSDIFHISDNAVTAAFFGQTQESLRNKRASEMGVPPDIVSLWIGHYRNSQLTGKPITFEYAHHSSNEERWLSATVTCLDSSFGARPRFAYVIVDVTERKLAQSSVRDALEREKAARFEAEVVRDANLALTRNLTLETVLATLLEQLGKLVPFDSANVMLLERESEFVIRAYRGCERSRRAIASANLSFDLNTHPSLKRLWSTQQSVVIADTYAELAWQKVAGTEYVRNWLAVPLIVSGKVVGVYSMDKSEPGFFTAEHVRLAETLAPPAASAIRNAQLFQESQRHREELEQRIAERECVEQALRQSESFRRTIIESQPECVKVVGQDYQLLDMNAAGLAMIGANSREQVIGQSVLELVAPEWRDRFVQLHERVCAGESLVSEFEIIGLNGARRRVETHAAPLRALDSKVVAHLAITIDITERKRAEESLNIFRNLIDRSTDAIEVLDPRTLSFLDCNSAAHQTLGYTREEFLSLSAFDIDPLINPAAAAALIEEINRSGHVIFESLHRRKDGSTFPVEINAKTVRLEKDYRLAVVRDISERKRAQERLQDYEKVVEGLEEMIVVVDREYRYLLANRAFLDYHKLNREQVIGRSAAEVVGDDVFEQSIRKHLDECFQGKVVRYEMAYVYPVRGERQLSVSYFPIAGSRGIDRAACVLSDITEQKRAQESLMQSESQLAEAQRLASVGSWNWDLRTRVVTWSDELYRIFGIPPQEIQLGATAIEFIHPHDRNLVTSTIEDALRTKEGYSFYYRIHRPDGVERMLHSRGLVVCDDLGEPIRLFGATQDVTEHRQAEEAQRQTEKKYREIFENAGEGIFQSTPDGRFIAANPALARICGFDCSRDLIHPRTDIAGDTYCEPELREEFKRRLEAWGVVREFEHQMLRKDGSRIWIMVNARVVRDEQGEVSYYEGTVQDINERKLAEARSAAFATLARRLSGAMTQLDAAKIIAETADKLFGWDSCNLDLYDEKSDLVQPLLNMDTIAGRRVNVSAAISARAPSPRTRQIINHGPELNLRKEPIEFDEDSIPFGDKSRPSASLMGVAICHAKTVIGLLSIQSYAQGAYDGSDLRDLQALATYCGEALNRVRIEESLRESEERYRELFENAKDAYYVHDLHGRYISVNRAAENLAGRKREEIIGQRFGDFIAPEQLPAVSEKLCRKLIEEGETNYETEVVASDGRRVPVEVTSHLIYENGVAVRVQGTARNITERKRAEAALRQSEREYRGLFENARDAILIIDPEQEIVLAVNQRACEVYGISRSEFVGISLQTISNNVERGRLVIKETLEQGMAHDFETIQRRGDGTEMFLHINASVVEYKGRIAIQSINRDITEQKRAEEALQRYPRQLIEAQEAERQSVARELHDQIGQVLTAIHLNLQAVRKTCETSEASVLIDEGVAIVDEALGQVRNLSFELRPSLLDDLGLAAALRWYTDRFTQRTGIQATTMISLPDPPARLTKELETACFRIAQEALTNVVRHAQARNVVVRLQKLNGQIRLAVKDDGVGFDAHSQNRAPFTTHLGLRGMRERALALSGRLDVKSSPRGTRISASFPQ
ncbi:MAG TPA: PAS domain S-box protein [Pyrinomonadaceae bacterium]|jgi:PAS domain S-box-containing protein|nr:PAS domain S-box protein [Pyrinomonadaceae bacterium]